MVIQTFIAVTAQWSWLAPDFPISALMRKLFSVT
jgi:hypothetical protein